MPARAHFGFFCFLSDPIQDLIGSDRIKIVITSDPKVKGQLCFLIIVKLHVTVCVTVEVIHDILVIYDAYTQ